MVANKVVYRNVANVVRKSRVLKLKEHSLPEQLKEREVVCSEIAHGLADFFSRDCKEFDTARFLRDCGIDA